MWFIESEENLSLGDRCAATDSFAILRERQAVNLPGDLNLAVKRWLQGQGGLAAKAKALSAAYRKGADSGHVNTAAYIAARLPATYAANEKVLREVAQVLPDFNPASVLDVGAGPGTAGWAALGRWPEIAKLVQVERDNDFYALAQYFNREGGLDVLAKADLQNTDFNGLTETHRADLVLATYVLAELPIAKMAGAARQLWAMSQQALVLIEPGTPDGFARLRIVRDCLLKEGAVVVAPCTHQGACPMVAGDWCHFKVRLQRSRAHMHAKQAHVPFEDEAFSYLVLSRQNVATPGSRVMRPPHIDKIAATLKLCDEDGLHNLSIASRNKASYKRAKHVAWGDVWSDDNEP